MNRPQEPSGREKEIAAIRERYARARDMVAALCSGDRDWIMSIPARPDYDPDIVIADSLKDIMTLLTAYEVQRTALEIVATGIHRDPERNMCWIHGEALDVHAVEAALRIQLDDPAAIRTLLGRTA